MLVNPQFKSIRDIYVFEEDQKYFMTPLPSHPKYNLLNGIKSKICSADSIVGIYIVQITHLGSKIISTIIQTILLTKQLMVMT